MQYSTIPFTLVDHDQAFILDVDALYETFLTQTFTARKTLLKKATAMLIPDIAQKLTGEALRLELAHSDRVRAELVERSEALLDIIAATLPAPTAEASNQVMITRLAAARALQAPANRIAWLDKMAAARHSRL